MSYYVLSKVSIPGWEFGANDLDTITGQLHAHVCKDCQRDAANLTDDTIDNAPDDITETFYLDALLDTTCGIEFLFDKYQSIFEYAKDTIIE